MIQRSILSSGVRVLTEYMPYRRSVSLGVWADVGSAAESSSKRGISHLLEHMLFKGTQRRSAREIATTMSDVGGIINAATSREHTYYYSTVLREDVPVAVDVLADMLLNAKIDPDALAKERDVVSREILRCNDTPARVLSNLYAKTLFGSSSLGDPVIGTQQTVAALTRDDLIEHLRTFYRGSSIVVTAAGDIEHEAFAALLESQLAGFAGSRDRPVAECPTVLPAHRVQFRESEQVLLAVVGRGTARDDPRKSTMRVLNTILGVGRSSRLREEVRDKRGLAYGVNSFYDAYRRVGICGVRAATAPHRTEECIDVLVREMTKLARTPVTAAELDRAKRQINVRRALASESTFARMYRLGKPELNGRHVSEDTVYEAATNAVTAADVQALASEFYAAENLGIFVLGPVTSSVIPAVVDYAGSPAPERSRGSDSASMLSPSR